MFTRIKESLLQFGRFSEEQLLFITSRLKVLPTAKGEQLIREGQVCRNFYFIERGSCRHYTILEDGSESTINLYIEGDWFFDYKSFITQQPSDGKIEATEKSEMLMLSGDNFHELVKTSDTFFQVGRIFKVAIENQEFQHKKMSPEAKYTQLLSTRPDLIKRFPLKYIASYLDMTPETLSRVRNKIIS